MIPRARREELVVCQVADEMLVYDKSREKVHALNPSAALVWRCCDGQTTVPEMAKRLEREMGLPDDDDLVRLALDRLAHAHLLEEYVAGPTSAARISRRAVARKLGLVAGITLLLPVVTSIVAPTPAQAATCLANNTACTKSSQCCSKCCRTTDRFTCKPGNLNCAPG